MTLTPYHQTYKYFDPSHINPLMNIDPKLIDQNLASPTLHEPSDIIELNIITRLPNLTTILENLGPQVFIPHSLSSPSMVITLSIMKMKMIWSILTKRNHYNKIPRNAL